MDISSVRLKEEYRSLTDDIVRDFYTPLLNNAVLYRRAVGFFSSSALVQIVDGIMGIVRNRGHIQLIASPHLDKEDIEAIELGYTARKNVVEKALERELTEQVSPYEKTQLNILANLIAQEYLDIRIAFVDDANKGMYHEKMGLISDDEGHCVAFTGSMNESMTAIKLNYEAFDVFCSWKDEDISRVRNKEKSFSRIWDNQEYGIQTFDFPMVKQRIIDSYLIEPLDFGDMQSEYKPVGEGNVASLPKNLSLFDYQQEAIDTWKRFSYQGIFDMATGTGKTLTALAGMTELRNHCFGRLYVVITCPYRHLVEQWAEDVVRFGIEPIIAYSGSVQKDWKKRLEAATIDYRLHVPGKNFVCVLCTVQTFRSSVVQGLISTIKDNGLLIADEAHNLGAKKVKRVLPLNFEYRLALSATLERHRDEEGTEVLYNYFGEKCIEYDLERAIREKRLSEYMYYPVLVSLTPEEKEAYDALTFEIAKCVIVDKKGKTTLTERGKMLALKRSRLTAAASMKIDKLRESMARYQEKNHILVYCGAANMFQTYDEDDDEISDSDIRQIDQVTEMLGNELHMYVSQFTAREDMQQREMIREKFKEGKDLQAIVAIKCLDEGVNIPEIRTAFILASTTNPKEYIQRRGRVLRKAPGKAYAEIYDFITLPYELDQIESGGHVADRLVMNEVARMQEFAELALNYAEADEVIREIMDAYGMMNITYEFLDDFGIDVNEIDI